MFETRNIRRSDITVDRSINSRQTIDDNTVKKLAQSIKNQGLIHPCLVVSTAQIQDYYDKIKTPYTLVCGFRRQAALDLLGITETDYRVVPSNWSIQDVIAANLAENLSREDLTSYELAMQCAKLKNVYGMSSKEISDRIRSNDCEIGDRRPLSESHVNNLIRCASYLHQDILSAWSQGHPRATLRTLITLAAEHDEQAQLSAWKGVVEPDSEDIEEIEDKRPSDRKAVLRKPSPQIISTMLDEAKKHSLSEKNKEKREFFQGVVAGLKFCCGLTRTIPGIKLAKASKASREE